MTLLCFLLVLAANPPLQTSTAVIVARVQVTQTCVLTESGSRCEGAIDRLAERRVIRSGSRTTFEF